MAGLVLGQGADSVIVGTVTDPAGALVPNAKITATNKDTNVKYDTVSNAAGEYRFNNVPVGRYDVSAVVQGFAPAKIADIQLDLNRTASVNLTLKVGTVSTEVEVVEAAAAIDTATSQIQTNWNAEALRNLPNAGTSKVTDASGIYNISLGNAGVALAGGIGQGVGPSVAGQRSENNSFSIDGVNNDNHELTGPLTYVSNEAVALSSQFFKSSLAPSSAAHPGGVFNVIVKSGTNQLHGSIYEYLQNRDLNAVDNTLVLSGNRTNPRFDSNRLGATVGGHHQERQAVLFRQLRI